MYNDDVFCIPILKPYWLRRINNFSDLLFIDYHIHILWSFLNKCYVQNNEHIVIIYLYLQKGFIPGELKYIKTFLYWLSYLIYYII